MEVDNFSVPIVIEAGSADELSRLMLANNLKNHKFFQYQIVSHNGKLQAWYYNSMKSDERVREEIRKIKAKAGKK